MTRGKKKNKIENIRASKPKGKKDAGGEGGRGGLETEKKKKKGKKKTGVERPKRGENRIEKGLPDKG